MGLDAYFIPNLKMNADVHRFKMELRTENKIGNRKVRVYFRIFYRDMELNSCSWIFSFLQEV